MFHRSSSLICLAALTTTALAAPPRTPRPQRLTHPGDALATHLRAVQPNSVLPRGVDLQAKLDAKVAKNNGFGGGLYRQASGTDGVLFEGVSGDLDHRGGVPIDPHDSFEIASTSKTITAVTVLLLMEEGLVGLDDPISTYLDPEITTALLVIDDHDYGPDLTPRQLLNHTSGLPDYWYDPPYLFWDVNQFLYDFYSDANHFWEPEELIEYAKELSPIAPPGTLYHYSDTGYVLLGLIAEAVTGAELHEIYRTRLFEPLGMGDTYLPYREAATSPYDESHRYEWRFDLHGKIRQSADWAGGGLVSSTRDLEQFAAALFGGEIFADPGTMDQMQQWVPTGAVDVWYGLGIFRIVFDGDVGELWGHDGYGNAWMYHWPEQDVTFTGTLNQALNDWWNLVVWGMVSVILGG